METVILPERLRPRVFTSSDGRKIQATITAIGEDKVTLMINGDSVKIEQSKLSESDREHLNRIPGVATKTVDPLPVDAFTLLEKTISYPHERRPDFMIRVQFKKDTEATFIGLGNVRVQWKYEQGDDPSVYFFWSHNQGATKERGYRLDINPDGKTGTVSRSRINYSVKATITPGI